MPATLFNAPARPPLTRTAILVLSIVLLAALAFVIGGSGSRPDPSAADRPAFTRRMVPDR